MKALPHGVTKPCPRNSNVVVPSLSPDRKADVLQIFRANPKRTLPKPKSLDHHQEAYGAMITPELEIGFDLTGPSSGAFPISHPRTSNVWVCPHNVIVFAIVNCANFAPLVLLLLIHSLASFVGRVDAEPSSLHAIRKNPTPITSLLSSAHPKSSEAETSPGQTNVQRRKDAGNTAYEDDKGWLEQSEQGSTSL